MLENAFPTFKVSNFFFFFFFFFKVSNSEVGTSYLTHTLK